jgi:hypothetical protein
MQFLTRVADGGSPKAAAIPGVAAAIGGVAGGLALGAGGVALGLVAAPALLLGAAYGWRKLQEMPFT